MSSSDSSNFDKYFDGYSYSYSGVSGLGHRLLHRALERGHGTFEHFDKVLEIGANTGEHAPYVRHSFREYTMSDLREYELPDDLRQKGFRYQIENAEKLSFQKESFDRVVVTCVLPHMREPESAIREIRRVLKPGAVADVYVGHDPSLAFDFARQVGPLAALGAKDLVWQRKVLNAREHLIGGRQLLVLLKEVFSNDDIRVTPWPARISSYHLNVWSTLRIRKRAK